MRKRLVAEQAHEQTVKAGESRLAELRKGEGAKPDDFGAPRSIRRSSAGDFPAAALEPVFRASADSLPAYAGVDLGEQGYAIYQIVSVTAPDEALLAQRRDAYRQQLSQAYSQQLLSDYVASVIADAKVVRYPERLGGNESR